jgi:hypothetical protein
MALWRFVEPGVVPDGTALKAAGRLSSWRRSCCETELGWAAREETGFALRTDLEKGLSITALSRCHERMQDRVVGVQKPTRIEGRLRQRCLTNSSAPSTGRSGKSEIFERVEDNGRPERRYSVAERSFSLLDHVQMFVKPMPQLLLCRRWELQDKTRKTQSLEDFKIAPSIRNDMRASAA